MSTSLAALAQKQEQKQKQQKQLPLTQKSKAQPQQQSKSGTTTTTTTNNKAKAKAATAAATATATPQLEPLSLSTSSSSSNSSNNNKEEPLPLYVRYPVNSCWSFETRGMDASATNFLFGTVYCTDEISQTIVLQKPLHHTTLCVDIHILQCSSILKEERLFVGEEDATTTTTPTTTTKKNTNSPKEEKNVKHNKKLTTTTTTSSSDEQAQTTIARTTPANKGTLLNEFYKLHSSLLYQPLPTVSKKILEERERKAIKLAEETLKHINQNATSRGQAVFDKLVKACNEVIWKGESILVLNQIQVDPPYGQEQCKIISTKLKNNNNNSLQDGSLDRVKKIVATISGVEDKDADPLVEVA